MILGSLIGDIGLRGVLGLVLVVELWLIILEFVELMLMDEWEVLMCVLVLGVLFFCEKRFMVGRELWYLFGRRL